MIFDVCLNVLAIIGTICICIILIVLTIFAGLGCYYCLQSDKNNTTEEKE